MESGFYDFIHDGGRYEEEYFSNKPFFTIDYHDLYEWNPDFSLVILNIFPRQLPRLESTTGKPIRFINLIETTPIRNINSGNINQLIQTQGIVTRATLGRSQLKTATWICRTCGGRQEVEQDTQFLKKPVECNVCQKKVQWELDLERSKYIDYQEVHIQESPDQLPPGETPITFSVTLLGDLVKSANPGDRVNIVGVVSVEQASPTDKKLELKRTLIANNVEVINKDLELMDFTEKDLSEITELTKEDYLYEHIAHSIAPNCYGYDHIKKGIALMLAGAEREQQGLTWRRGDSHILLVGDPGVYKSQFLQLTSKIAPRGMLTTGRGSTAAGLTAAAISDGDGWVIEAGAMVLADKGVCCIDEMDKMKARDRDAIHPAMEQQVVMKNAAGKNVILNSRCSVLAAANPIHGRWNEYQTVAENLNPKKFPPTLLSRFDLVFIILDKPDKEADREVARIILNTSTRPTMEPIPPALLKKYFSYCKQVKPKINEQVMGYVEDYYVELRRRNKDNSAVAITPRQLESIRRLIFASARLHMRKVATLEDAKNALELFEKSMTDVGVDPLTGKMDIDLLEVGQSKTMTDLILVIERTVKQLREESSDGRCGEDELVMRVNRMGVEEDKVRSMLRKMERMRPPLIYTSMGCVYPC